MFYLLSASLSSSFTSSQPHSVCTWGKSCVCLLQNISLTSLSAVPPLTAPLFSNLLFQKLSRHSFLAMAHYTGSSLITLAAFHSVSKHGSRFCSAHAHKNTKAQKQWFHKRRWEPFKCPRAGRLVWKMSPALPWQRTIFCARGYYHGFNSKHKGHAV